jgi:hypothetical protein
VLHKYIAQNEVQRRGREVIFFLLHPHLNPLPSRERRFDLIWSPVEGEEISKLYNTPSPGGRELEGGGLGFTMKKRATTGSPYPR